jgi:hypothetical protein
MRQITLAHPSNKLEKQLINLFHSSNLPLHFNKTGNKEFTNYQRVSIIILFHRSKKSLRDFVEELKESKWISWLGLKKIPKKSTLHDWLKIFNMKIIRKLSKVLLPKEIKLTAIDGTGIDSWQRSRHYENRIRAPPMPYAKVDLFVDVKTKKVLDFSLICKKRHDVVVAEKIFKRNSIQGMAILGDKGYDSEPLHELVRSKGGILYAPVRKTNKKSLKRKRPKGIYRRQCVELPEFMGQRSIIESVNSSLKQKQIHSLRAKKGFMKQREFGWQMIWYNLRIELDDSTQKELNFFILKIEIYVFPDIAVNWQVVLICLGCLVIEILGLYRMFLFLF